MESGTDLLSEALGALKIDASGIVVFEFSAPWGFSACNDLPISWTVVEGSVWLVAPDGKPMRFDAGDTFLLPRGTPSGEYSFLSAPDVHPYPVEELWRQNSMPRDFTGRRGWARPYFVRWGGGGALTRVVSLAFGFNDRLLGPLLEALPERMIVRANELNGDFLQVLLNFPFGDGDPEPGFPVIASHTAQLLLTYLVRTYALKHQQHGHGWLGGLSNPRMARVLAAVHRQPDQPWTVETLASLAGMSRSHFAEYFQACMGQSPARYVCEWRMHLAREGLASGRSVTELSHALGYRSEAAFRAAFRRITGQPPKVFQRTSLK